MNRLLHMLIVLFPVTVLSQNHTPDEWRLLFNGKDLSGWKQINGQASFEVKDGVLIGTAILNSPNSFLATEETFGDFILEAEFLTEGTNTGIQFRSESKPDFQNGRVFGYQMEIDPTSRAWTGGIYDEARRQWLYPLEYNPPAKTAFKHNTWNSCRIECIGNTLRTWINGKPAAHLIDDMTLNGFIALQVHSIDKNEDEGKQVKFRDIRIKTTNLSPSPWDDLYVENFVPNTLSEQEKLNGVKLLWDGLSTSGWQSVDEEKISEKFWRISDGMLNAMSNLEKKLQHVIDIMTIEEFSSFDLQFEFKMTSGSGSGVKYFVTDSEEKKGSYTGLEYQIIDDEHADAKSGVNGNRTLSSLYDLIPSVKNSRGLKKTGEWNKGRIVVRSTNWVEHWLNGYKVLEYNRSAPSFQALLSRSSSNASRADFGKVEKGHILLEYLDGGVSFRSIRIRALK